MALYKSYYYYYYYFLNLGRSSQGGRQKLILEIITLMVNHPSGSHQQALVQQGSVEMLYQNGNSLEQHGHVGSKTLHQLNRPLFNWRRQVTQADLYNG